MFFKTIEEFQQYYPLSEGLSLSLFKPHYWVVAGQHFIPLLGQSQWDELVAAYDTASGDLNALTAAEQKLIEAIRKPFAYLTIYHYIPIGNVEVTPGGFKVQQTETLKPASQARVAALSREVLTQAYFGLDKMVQLLQENEDDYATWKGSSAYQEMHRHFVRTAHEFQYHYDIKTNRYVFWQMLPVMSRIEEFRIEPLLGDTLFTALTDKLKAGDSLSSQETALVKKIKPAVIHLTLADALVELSVQIDDRGITLYSNDNSQTMEVSNAADDSRLSSLGQIAMNRGVAALKVLEKFMDDNHADYPDYEYEETKTHYLEKDSSLPGSIHL